jgi:prepilin-type N-terminal cleavage/methylation domain-containing protein
MIYYLFIWLTPEDASIENRKSKIENAKSGFSLIEVLFAVLLVGLAIASLMSANGAFTKANGAGTDQSTAEFLIGQIREMAALLPVIDPQTELATFGPETGETLATYDDLDDFDAAGYSPPINSERTSLNSPSLFSADAVERIEFRAGRCQP